MRLRQKALTFDDVKAFPSMADTFDRYDVDGRSNAKEVANLPRLEQIGLRHVYL